MQKANEQLLNLVQIILKTLETLSSEQINSLIAETGVLTYKKSASKERKPQKESPGENPLYDLLVTAKSREQAASILANCNKSELNALAQKCKVLVFKNDNREKIKKKIIEAVIGSQLEFVAIQETDLKGHKSQAD